MPLSAFEPWQPKGRRERPHHSPDQRGRDNCGIHPPCQGTSEATTDWHFLSPWQTGFFSFFFFFLSYLAAASDSTSPTPHAFCFSSEIRTELGIFVNCRWESPAGVFRQANLACAPSLVCSPLNCIGIKFSSSCLHWDWEKGEGSVQERGVGEGERGRERRGERGGGEREGGEGSRESGERGRLQSPP